MTTTDINGYLGPGETQAVKPINIIPSSVDI